MTSHLEITPTYRKWASIADTCYASANIKALETLRYAEHICYYFGILDSWFSGKIYAIKKGLNTRPIMEFSWIEVFGKQSSL